MKNFKKILAVILTVVTLMGICAFSASAATSDPPSFELRIVSQSGKNAVLELVLVDGGFNSLDITFKTSSNISSFSSIYTSDAFDAYVKELKKAGEQLGESTSAKNKKVSMASTALIKKNVAIYEIKVVKKTTEDLLGSDITAKVTECIIGNKSVKNSVTVNNIFGKVEIKDKADFTLTYKQSKTLEATSTYKDGVVWSSSNANVATIDSNGKITTTGTGTAVITASSPDGSITDSCNVTVEYSWWQWIIVIVLFGWIWY